ncbi:MAG TPA: ATP-binding protein [Noviherbaspirillum sp.]|jgi:signal transduction histidine kinase/CheY-like chemotaxis protein|uniref:hybrid sensor histidine kinase/response regulator n=1 Tax=Noviherbaspirillum sp. TaxID=1926288 RepID=UPI002DDD8C34|nr:ATP-binding protein [Noviherbaspirillum sp.]HEV2609738.1 ATP-binding protein [Noviherbaspirillum sp.]
MPERTQSLRKSLFKLAAIGLIPLAIVGTWGIGTTISQQEREMKRSALDLSRALASAVNAELDSTVSSLRTLSYTTALNEHDTRQFYDIAQKAVKAKESWSGVILTDAGGEVIFKTVLPFGEPGGRVIDPKSLQQVIQTNAPAVGPIAMGQVPGYAFPVRVPVIVDGRLTYILTAAIKPDRLLEIVQRQNVPRSWAISVFDQEGNRVARSKDHEKTVATKATPSLAALMAENALEGTGMSKTLEGDESLTGYSKLVDYNWSVAVGIPTAELRTATYRTLAVYAFGILVSLALCTLLAIRMSRKILDSLETVRKQAVLFEQGKPVDIAQSPYPEIDALANALRNASLERADVETERERLLASLKEALARAEEASQAKDQFLAILGHELRNPLAPMVTILHLMELRGDTAMSRERQIMSRQVAHMKRLVDDLLDVSRITQGRLEMQNEEVSLAAVIEQAMEAVASLPSAKDINVRLPESPVWLRGDMSRLVQAITNLLTNALRFDPSGNILLTATTEGSTVRIAVSDHGTGISKEALARIFEPFFQGPQQLARASGGLGLGLAIVRHIVERHGGTVSAASGGSGKGSTFEILLPTCAQPSTRVDDSEPPESEHLGRIAIIDDNVDAATTIAEALRIAGHDVCIGHSAAQGLRLVDEFNPDIAILDIGLPDMDGFELAQSIRSQNKEWKGRLIALSGYGQKADKVKAASHGFEAHLTKPASIAELLAVTEALLASGKT